MRNITPKSTLSKPSQCHPYRWHPPINMRTRYRFPLPESRFPLSFLPYAALCLRCLPFTSAVSYPHRPGGETGSAFLGAYMLATATSDNRNALQLLPDSSALLLLAFRFGARRGVSRGALRPYSRTMHSQLLALVPATRPLNTARPLILGRIRQFAFG